MLAHDGGFLYEPTERDGLLGALRRAADDRGRLDAMGQRNLAKNRQDDWPTIGGWTLAVYRACLSAATWSTTGGFNGYGRSKADRSANAAATSLAYVRPTTLKLSRSTRALARATVVAPSGASSTRDRPDAISPGKEQPEYETGEREQRVGDAVGRERRRDTEDGPEQRHRGHGLEQHPRCAHPGLRVSESPLARDERQQQLSIPPQFRKVERGPAAGRFDEDWAKAASASAASAVATRLSLDCSIGARLDFREDDSPDRRLRSH